MTSNKIAMGQATVQRQRQVDFKKQPREVQLASVLYPSLTDDATQAAMKGLAAGEGRKAPKTSPLLSDVQRGAVSKLGGVAQWKK